MSDNITSAGADMPDHRTFSELLQRTNALKNDEPPMPSSKPLQVFLLVAFLITGAAYVVNEWIEMTNEKAHAKYPSRLHELVQSQSLFIEHTDAGKRALEKKHADQAVSEFRMALEAQQSAEGHENLGAALLQVGDPDPAFAQFREAARLNPKLTAAYDSWGQALSAEGKPDEAASVYQAALEHNPDSGVLHYDLALTLQTMQRNAAAARHEAEAAGKTDDVAADDAQVKSLASQAIQQFTRASRLGIDTPAFWTGYGALLSEQGRYAEAESTLNRALARNPDMADARFQLAHTQVQRGNYADAIGNYEKVLTLRPDNPEVLNSLALLYVSATNSEVNSPKMGILLATRACAATTSQNARFMDTLARAYAATGDFFQAITWEEKALKRANQISDEELVRQLQSRYQLYLDHKTD